MTTFYIPKPRNCFTGQNSFQEVFSKLSLNILFKQYQSFYFWGDGCRQYQVFQFLSMQWVLEVLMVQYGCRWECQDSTLPYPFLGYGESKPKENGPTMSHAMFFRRKILQYHFGTYPKNIFDHWMKMVQSGPSNWFIYFKKI